MYCNTAVKWLTFCHFLFNLLCFPSCFTYKLGHDSLLSQPTFFSAKKFHTSASFCCYVMSFSSLGKRMTACKELKEHLRIFSLPGSQLSSKLTDVQQNINKIRNKLNAKLNISNPLIFCNKSVSPSNKSG